MHAIVTMQENDELHSVLENPMLPVAQKEAFEELFPNACLQTINFFAFSRKQSNAIVATLRQHMYVFMPDTRRSTKQ